MSIDDDENENESDTHNTHNTHNTYDAHSPNRWPQTVDEAVARILAGMPKEDQQRARTVMMAAVDQINARFGRDTLRLAASGIERPWGMRQAHRSPRYTTRWEELVRAW